MCFSKEKKVHLIALSIGALSFLSSCGQETANSHDDVDESEAATALTSDYTVPIYPGSTLFETRHANSSIPASVTVIGKFHSADACPEISDWFSRRLRMQGWNVADIDKQPTSVKIVARKEKAECTLNASNDGTTTTIEIMEKTPK